MTLVDILVIALLAVSTLLAAMRGLIREISTLLCVITAAGMAYILVGPLGALTGLETRGTVTALLLGLGIFVALFVLWAVFIDGLISRYAGKSPGRIDRLMGGLFGFLRGYLLVGFMFLTLAYYSIADPAASTEEWVAARYGVTAPLVRSAGNILKSFGISPDAQPGPQSEPQSASKTDIGQNHQNHQSDQSLQNYQKHRNHRNHQKHARFLSLSSASKSGYPAVLRPANSFSLAAPAMHIPPGQGGLAKRLLAAFIPTDIDPVGLSGSDTRDTAIKRGFFAEI